MSILVLGSSGQLARHLRESLDDARFFGRETLDLSDAVAAEAALLEAAPAAIVNAAAYTAVDQAEDEPASAWSINVGGAAGAARAAARLDIPMIHVSTDYVFDGDSERPYRDTDPARPVSVYGRTKLAGELAVTSLCRKHWILRTSWLFSELDGNFVTTMLRLARTRDRIRVVADQRGRPTYAGDLARAISDLATGQIRGAVPWGIYHFGGGVATTWHEFAKQIISQACEYGLVEEPPLIEPIGSADYPTRAQRPMNSILEPSDTLHRALRAIPNWKKGLDEVLARLGPAP